jgi:hypothetical protein
VAQLYPQAPATHFSRLLRHPWATVGLFFSPVTTRGIVYIRMTLLATAPVYSYLPRTNTASVSLEVLDIFVLHVYFLECNLNFSVTVEQTAGPHLRVLDLSYRTWL